jgi:hypothetical protein
MVVCSKEAGATYGRCSNWMACNPAGNTCKLDSVSCSQEAVCCAGNTQVADTCQLDALGIPRCALADGQDCTDPTSYEGMACASSADCCGLPCVPDSGGGFVCGATCVDEGQVCTTSSDCCSGLQCNIPTGETSGTCGMDPGGSDCAEVGQLCDAMNPCCNDVECNSKGYCGTIVID